jgi:tetratricopeptide (TPR) repeat protein
MKPIFSLPMLVFAASFLAGCSLPVKEAPPEPVAVATVEQDPPAKSQSPAGKESSATEQEAADDRLPDVALTPKLLYRFLLAEIAGQRGQLTSSADLYLELARETRDPRIARRATELALHGRRMEAALDSARLWYEVEPASVQARQALVSLLAAQGKYDELKTLLAALLAAEPQQLGQNLLHLNRMFARTGDRAAARAMVDALTAPYLQVPEAHYARALAAFEARDTAAARSAIARALELKPDWEAAALLLAQLTENRTEAMAMLERFVSAHPGARDARLAYARALVGEKRYADARREFNTLLAQAADDPAKNGDVIFAIAVLSLQLNDTAQAEKQLRRLVEIGHVEADKARYYLGQIAEEGKRWDEAQQWFVAVGRGEHYLSARLHAASVLAKQGKLDEARRQLEGAETANPQEKVQLLIGEAQLLREAGKVADAHAVLAAGLEAQPDQPDLLYETALLAEKLGRAEELETRLRRLIELRPDHAHALNALAYSLAERNERLDEASALLDRALQLAPNDPFILDSKGWVLFRQGASQAALEVLKTAFGIRPDPEIAAHLGEVLWTLGRQAEARTTWDKARRDNPANEALTETIKRLSP